MQVDAVKRNCIKVLPHMLVIHLKRFEYDYETMNRWKIKDRYSLNHAPSSKPPAKLNRMQYSAEKIAGSVLSTAESSLLVLPGKGL